MYDLRIVLCDDSMLVRKKLKDALTDKGFTQLFEAVDGEQAVALCLKENPDLVLLDITMPKMDGLEALQEIKMNNPSIKVVIASSLGTQANLMKAIKLGADNFLQKPIEIEAILDILHKISKQRGER